MLCIPLRLIGLLMVAISLATASSVVVLDSGEQLIGEVLPQSTEQTLVLHSNLLGELFLPRGNVILIESLAPEEEAAPQQVSETSLAHTETTTMSGEALKVVDTLRDLKAADEWNGNIRFGFNLSAGDRKWAESYANGKLEIDPEQSPNFYRFTGSYTYRESERSDGSTYKVTDKYDAEFIYRRTFIDDLFVQNSLGGRVDRIKGINREVQESVGLGYKYKPTDRIQVLFGGGGGVEDLDTEYEDTRTGLNPVLNVFQEAEWKPLERTSLVQKFNYYWNPDVENQFYYVLSAAIRVRLTDLLGVEFSYHKSYDNDVGNGNAQDDVQWRNALVVYF